MKTIFDKITRNELINRIRTLDQDSSAQWGKMNIYQMVKHCCLWQEMILGKKIYKQTFIGRLFGRIILKKVVKDDSPMKHGTPTLPEFRISEQSGDLAAEKKKWIAMIEETAYFTNPNFVHPFFGTMTKEEVGYHVYKHIDHHLRQFNR